MLLFELANRASLSGQAIGSINDAFVIAEWHDHGGPSGPPRLIDPPHLHRNDYEARYVPEGALRVRVGRKEVEAHAGSAVFVPRGTPHTYWNPCPSPTRYLLVRTSNIYRGNSRDERTHPRLASRRIRKVRLRTVRFVIAIGAFGFPRAP